MENENGSNSSLSTAEQRRRSLLAHFNLTDSAAITWAHAVNSNAKLAEALSDVKTMFIEADVLLVTEAGHVEPVMAHPPATEFDMTFARFLELATPSAKGLKIDFKSPEAVEPSLRILDAYKNKVYFILFGLRKIKKLPAFFASYEYFVKNYLRKSCSAFNLKLRNIIF
jgi:hypothetical protein